MQRREMHRGAQLVENLWGDELVREQVRAPVHHAMPHGRGRSVNVFFDRRSESGEGVALRLVNSFFPDQNRSVRRTNVQSAVAASNALGASRQHRFFIARAAAVDAELQRRRTAVENEDQIVFCSRALRHGYPGHFQLRISSLSMPSACA